MLGGSSEELPMVRLQLPMVLGFLAGLALGLHAQEMPRGSQASIAMQPFAQHVRRLETAMRYLGQPFPAPDLMAINDAIGAADESDGVARAQQVLDKHVLVKVTINPESRVQVDAGAARPDLVQGGARLFLVTVVNQAGVTAPIAVKSPNTGNVYMTSRGSPEPQMVLTDEDVNERWADISIYDKSPMRPRLSGLGVEYAILQIYSRDAGQRSAILGFNVGQGTQDIGFRNDIDILFTAAPSFPLRVRVQDEKGQPTTASFLIRDELDRVYPNISKRIAPDFYFQPQVYRADGASIHLPAGSFTVTASRGPEYV